jgi:hypothetical protein
MAEMESNENEQHDPWHQTHQVLENIERAHHAYEFGGLAHELEHGQTPTIPDEQYTPSTTTTNEPAPESAAPMSESAYQYSRMEDALLRSGSGRVDPTPEFYPDGVTTNATEASFFQKGPKTSEWEGAGAEAAEGAEGAEAASGLGGEASALGVAAGAAGTIAGAWQFANGVSEYQKGTEAGHVQGGADMLAGGAGVVSGGVGMLAGAGVGGSAIAAAGPYAAAAAAILGTEAEAGWARRRRERERRRRPRRGGRRRASRDGGGG